jgi:hypothetical protein
MLSIETSSGRWDAFPTQVRGFLEADTIDLVIDGRPVRGYRSPDAPSLWIRDHSDMLRVGRYFEADVQSAVECFADAQHASGRIYDYVTTVPEKTPCERENWEKWVRVPVEADVEYRFVKAAYLAWQATGDHEWASDLLPALDRALGYTHSHEWRWDETHGLVKRPYTIDTWDFDYTAGRADWLNFQVTDDTYWGLFHGDNSGFYESGLLLAQLYEQDEQPVKAQAWNDVAERVRERANERLFNGRFYEHFHKLTEVEIEGVDESRQLSLSNPMAINRGLATPTMARAIIEEYRRRRAATESFAEWFSVDPPFPQEAFGVEKLVPGAYVNGGIFPLCGGELARAALAHGFERYGVETLAQYCDMVAERGAAHLWYFPDGTPATEEASTSPDAEPTDGWGSTAMVYGLVEGLCGIEDQGHSFRRVRCAPRWVAADEEEATVRLSYAASGASFSYRFVHDASASAIQLMLEGERAEVALHVLLPEGVQAESLAVDGSGHAFENVSVRESPYVDARVAVEGDTEVVVRYE